MKNRFWEIDLLRGVSIFLVVLIHSSYYFIGSNQTALILWNYSQFCVPAFIFCAAYVYFNKDHNTFSTWQFSHYMQYIKKRFIRLLKPYYLFLIPFFILQFLIHGEILNTRYIIQSVFVIGGVDISWLILLFLQITLLLPIISFLLHKQKLLAYTFFILSLVSSISYTLHPANYKLLLWLPWSFILFFTYFFMQIQNSIKKMFLLLGVAILLYVGYQQYFLSINHHLSFVENKYPPNLFYLSYGILCIVLVYLLSPFLTKIIKPLLFLSKYSYHIFFIHYFFLILFASQKALLQLQWWMFFGLVFGATLVTLHLLIFTLSKRK